jgi:hypothetical protein
MPALRLGAHGLTEVSTAELRTLLRAVHRAEARCPLDLPELARHGLQHVAEPLLATLRGLDATAVRAVLVAVIAERLDR